MRGAQGEKGQIGERGIRGSSGKRAHFYETCSKGANRMKFAQYVTWANCD